MKKGVTPSEVVYEEDRLKLLHYLERTASRVMHAAGLCLCAGEPALHSGSQRRAAASSLNFVERGFDTYLVDWGVPTDADRHLTLDDYINGYMVT